MLWRLVTMHHGAENSFQKEKLLHNSSDQLFALNLRHFPRKHNIVTRVIYRSLRILTSRSLTCVSLHNVTPNFNFASMTQQPSLPPPLPNTQVPTLVQELETANTLLDLHGSKNTDTSNEPANSQNNATPVNWPEKTDAMDKIVDCCEMYDPVINVLKVPDAMDCIIRNGSEQDNLSMNVLNAETFEQNTCTDLISDKQDLMLNVKTVN